MTTPSEPFSAAAIDLGLTEKMSVEAYMERISSLFILGCAHYGVDNTARIFRDQARRAASLQVRSRPTRKSIPPKKQRGAHDPEGDDLLVQLWRACCLERPKLTKEEFSKFACKNHVHNIEPKSLVKRLNRALARMK
jgi:hypothetical protein